MGTRIAVLGLRTNVTSAIPASTSRRSRVNRHATTVPAATSGTTWPTLTACMTHHGARAPTTAIQRPQPVPAWRSGGRVEATSEFLPPDLSLPPPSYASLIFPTHGRPRSDDFLADGGLACPDRNLYFRRSPS